VPGSPEAAKDWIRTPKRRQPNPKVAQGKLEIRGHLDEHAEKALDELKSPKTPSRTNARPASVRGLFLFMSANASLSNREPIDREPNHQAPCGLP